MFKWLLDFQSIRDNLSLKTSGQQALSLQESQVARPSIVPAKSCSLEYILDSVSAQRTLCADIQANPLLAAFAANSSVGTFTRLLTIFWGSFANAKLIESSKHLCAACPMSLASSSLSLWADFAWSAMVVNSSKVRGLIRMTPSTNSVGIKRSNF